MNFENKLQTIMSVDHEISDKTAFLDKLYHRWERQLEKKQKVLSGASAIGLVILTGLLTFSQLDIHSDIYADETSSIETEIYIDDLAMLLLEFDEDVWTVLELLEEVNHETITEIKETI